MSTTVKNFKITNIPPNERNVFTDGDSISGHVVLEVAKECVIQSLSVKFKGKAEVSWTEILGDRRDVYFAKDKYFTNTRYFIKDDQSDGTFYEEQPLLTNEQGETYSNVVSPGCHVYPFTFQIPPLDLPSSFKGSDGKILYTLEAKLSRSMRMSKKESLKINFVSKEVVDDGPEVICDSKEKKLNVFSSGTVFMEVNIEKTVFHQGEGIKVVAYIENNSSRPVKPKYCLYRKHSFFAKGERKLDTKDLLREVGETIPPGTVTTVTKVITVPPDVEPSIYNCDIITVEHRLRVYLDVKFARDPEIKFPITILPLLPGAAAPPALDPGSGFPEASCETPEPPAWACAPPSAPPHYEAPPPSYDAHALYPSLSDFGNKQ